MLNLYFLWYKRNVFYTCSEGYTNVYILFIAKKFFSKVAKLINEQRHLYCISTACKSLNKLGSIIFFKYHNQFLIV